MADTDLFTEADAVLKRHDEFERHYRVLVDDMGAARAMPRDTAEERLAFWTRRAEVNSRMADLLTARGEAAEAGSLIAWALLVAADTHRERAESAQERAESAQARLDRAGGGAQ
jgi:hypothetical protein